MRRRESREILEGAILSVSSNSWSGPLERLSKGRTVIASNAGLRPNRCPRHWSETRPATRPNTARPAGSIARLLGNEPPGPELGDFRRSLRWVDEADVRLEEESPLGHGSDNRLGIVR